jgi:glucosamine--fructose-6-phosphate aminotransferase (isomerizing)
VSELRVFEGGYLRDVLDQPRALGDTIARLDVGPLLRALAGRLAAAGHRRTVLSGMGSSLHGLVPLQLRLVAAGHAPVLVDASELLHHQAALLVPGTLLVLMSQSGRSAEIVRLLELVEGRGIDVLALTNTPGSPLERGAAATILTHAGEEATVSCKTYVAAQAALAYAGELLAGGDPEQVRPQLEAAVPAVADYLASWRDHVAALAPLLRGTRALYYTGRGASVAAACTAGLITKESTHHPAEGMSSAAFRHGPLEMLDPDVFLLVFDGEARTRALNRALVDDARRAGARAYLAGEEAPQPAFRLPVVADVVRPVVELLPVEMITLATAALDGREAGRFERTGKITASE